MTFNLLLSVFKLYPIVSNSITIFDKWDFYPISFSLKKNELERVVIYQGGSVFVTFNTYQRKCHSNMQF